MAQHTGNRLDDSEARDVTQLRDVHGDVNTGSITRIDAIHAPTHLGHGPQINGDVVHGDVIHGNVLNGTGSIG
ncbi:hypothetical protein [Streptomyces sp. NPDC049879]|uniref:hypothetical protein n=1 Tax=Streptomyces sp. NPDC049879 TaxID=3365598 RepID=UPI00378C4A75